MYSKFRTLYRTLFKAFAWVNVLSGMRGCFNASMTFFLLKGSLAVWHPGVAIQKQDSNPRGCKVFAHSIVKGVSLGLRRFTHRNLFP